MVYDHRAIEEKWQDSWRNDKIFQTDLEQTTDKFYCLDMFPYPSGEGLHVGHWRGYVLSDFYARYHQLQGKNVLHPMGFDSFGLPAENAAIKTGSRPKEFTDRAMIRFRQQLDRMGAMFDWTKQVVTSDPSYYRWTQWLFLQLFKHGLAAKRLGTVNWCPKDQTVLANEQVVAGLCERCGTIVTKKELPQWYFNTTEFAEDLLGGLETVNWPEHVKTLQRNWIGRSDGASVKFDCPKNPGRPIETFTTRVDTIYGVNALVLAPEYPQINKLVTDDCQAAVNKFLALSRSMTNIDRQQAEITARSAVFTGALATHPLTGQNLPIWLADYVMTGYGTGAVMSVPAHDQRDYQFSQVNSLPIKPVVSSVGEPLPYSGHGQLINSGPFTGVDSRAAQPLIIAELEKSGHGQASTNYRLRDWLVSRQRYWGAPIPIVYDPDGQPHPVEEKHLPLLLPEDVDFTPDGASPLTRSKEYVRRAENLYGPGWHFETDTLDTFVDSSWYFLRYLSPTDTNQPFVKNLVKKWLPVDLYIGGIEHATLHLLYARFISRFLAKYGYINSALTEPFQQLFNIGMVNFHGQKMSKSKGNVVAANELVERFGADALRGYLLFLGPMAIEVEWTGRGINGIHRFLIRICQLSDRVLNEDDPNSPLAGQFDHYLLAINEMISQFRLNTVLSEAMKLVNRSSNHWPLSIWQKFLVTLAPIFPHLAEELWQKAGGKESIFNSRWPETSAGLPNIRPVSVRLNHRHLGSVIAPNGANQKQLLEIIKGSKMAAKIGENIQRRVIFKDDFVDFIDQTG